MDYAGVNALAVVAAAAASFLFGGLWYTVFGTAWLEAIDKTYEDLKREGGFGPLPMAVALIAQLLMAFMFASALGYLGPQNITLLNGVIAGAAIWAGFILTTLITNNQFQVHGFELVLIDGGHWLCVLLIQGAIIGWMGLSI